MYFVLFLLLVTAHTNAAQMVTLGKRLNDGAGPFGQRFLAVLEADPAPQAKMRAMEPFIIGFFGWKALRMLNVGVGQIEANHVGICATMIGFYDPEVVTTLNAIAARPKSPVEWLDTPDAERKQVQRFVVIKQSDRWGTFKDLESGGLPEVDPRSRWQWEVGSLLGEMAADVTMWYKFPNYPPFDRSVGEYLARLDKKLNEAPAGTPTSFIQAARRLAALKSKPVYTVAQRDQVAAEMANTMLTAVAFATAGTGFPKPGQSTTASSVPTVRTPQAAIPKPSPAPITRSTPPPTVRSTPVPIVRPTPALSSGTARVASPAVRAATLFDEGKKLASAGSHSAALVKFNEAARLAPLDGNIFFYRGLSNYALKFVDKAIEDMSAAIRFRAFLSLAYYNRGTFYLDKKLYTQAKADFDQSIAIDKTDHRFFYNRGLANFNLAAYDPAYADFTKTIELNRKHSNAFIMRARVLCKKGLLLSAITDQNEAIKLGAKVTRGCS